MEKRKRSLAIDILNGPMWDKILRYALPVAATGILGQLFNASDIAIVGNFAEGDTVAAGGGAGGIPSRRSQPSAQTDRSSACCLISSSASLWVQMLS